MQKNIIKWGYQKSINDYVNCLFMSDIIPVTSNHDFFGISVMEAVFCNVWPILPDRLSYKELFKNKGHTENIYTNDNQLMKKIEAHDKIKPENTYSCIYSFFLDAHYRGLSK